MENNEALNLFKNFLRKRRLYLTNSRIFVLEAALQRQVPFDVEALWTALKAKPVGLTTVYRTLSLLVEAGLVRRIAGRTDYFEVIYQKAAAEYLHCTHCGQWIPFSGMDFRSEITSLAQQLGFTIANIQFTIQGECRSCMLAKVRSFEQMNETLWK